MGQYGQRAADLLEWAARKFAGEDLHQRIFWDAVDPFSGATARSTARSMGSLGRSEYGRSTAAGPTKGRCDRLRPCGWRPSSSSTTSPMSRSSGGWWPTRTRARRGERFVVRRRRNRGPRRREDTILLHPRVPSLGVGTRPATDALWLGARMGPSEPLVFATRKSSYWRYNASASDAFALSLMIEKGETAAASEWPRSWLSNPRPTTTRGPASPYAGLGLRQGRGNGEGHRRLYRGHPAPSGPPLRSLQSGRGLPEAARVRLGDCRLHGSDPAEPKNRGGLLRSRSGLCKERRL